MSVAAEPGQGSRIKGALYGASAKGLLEEDVRRDYVLSESCPNVGKPIGDSFLTLMDEVVLIGLKDQQVRTLPGDCSGG